MTSNLSKDAFRSRERALEDEFFMKVDQKLLADLKAQMDATEKVRQLRVHTSFHDEHLLDELVELGVSVESITAMSIIPMVLVAWADFQIDRLERFDILQVAAADGIEADKPAGQLLNHWLNNRPTANLKETWSHYAQAVLSKLTEKGRKSMKAEVLKRVRSIAKVSGGPLGSGVVTSEQKRVIDEIESVFESASKANG